MGPVRRGLWLQRRLEEHLFGSRRRRGMTSEPRGMAQLEEYAKAQDSSDPLRGFRERFHFPDAPSGKPFLYFLGHSLGLQPRSARAFLEREMEAWARLGGEGHFRPSAGRPAWMELGESLLPALGRVVGAE